MNPRALTAEQEELLLATAASELAKAVADRLAADARVSFWRQYIGQRPDRSRPFTVPGDGGAPVRFSPAPPQGRE